MEIVIVAVLLHRYQLAAIVIEVPGGNGARSVLLGNQGDVVVDELGGDTANPLGRSLALGVIGEGGRGGRTGYGGQAVVPGPGVGGGVGAGCAR